MAGKLSSSHVSNGSRNELTRFSFSGHLFFLCQYLVLSNSGDVIDMFESS